MAFGLHFAVFASARATGNGPVLNENVRSIGGSSQATGVMDASAGNRARRVRVAVDTNCWVTWGAPGIAALTNGTEGRPMGTDISTVEYFDIQADHVIAVIART